MLFFTSSEFCSQQQITLSCEQKLTKVSRIISLSLYQAYLNNCTVLTFVIIKFPHDLFTDLFSSQLSNDEDVHPAGSNCVLRHRNNPTTRHKQQLIHRFHIQSKFTPNHNLITIQIRRKPVKMETKTS